MWSAMAKLHTMLVSNRALENKELPWNKVSEQQQYLLLLVATNQLKYHSYLCNEWSQIHLKLSGTFLLKIVLLTSIPTDLSDQRFRLVATVPLKSKLPLSRETRVSSRKMRVSSCKTRVLSRKTRLFWAVLYVN